mmetsp:Transcript_30435/g.78181  ORF Transcript_30435/g.78181 Transcript_30435/m.78181 type:complete len:222 (-) Transcript_30435:514-1179(-)
MSRNAIVSTSRSWLRSGSCTPRLLAMLPWVRHTNTRLSDDSASSSEDSRYAIAVTLRGPRSAAESTLPEAIMAASMAEMEVVEETEELPLLPGPRLARVRDVSTSHTVRSPPDVAVSRHVAPTKRSAVTELVCGRCMPVASSRALVRSSTHTLTSPCSPTAAGPEPVMPLAEAIDCALRAWPSATVAPLTLTLVTGAAFAPMSTAHSRHAPVAGSTCHTLR